MHGRFTAECQTVVELLEECFEDLAEVPILSGLPASHGGSGRVLA